MNYAESLNIGFIQTIVEGQIAWPIIDGENGKESVKNMSQISEERAIQEIQKGFIDLLNTDDKPQIIVLPELAVPLGYEYELRKLCASSGAVVIAGLDFYWRNGMVSNRGIVCIPRNWPTQDPSRSTSFFYFGKTHYSQYEEKRFPGKLEQETAIYLLDADKYGKIGIAICSDFFDIERFVVYKGRIHHLIIIAHNIDTDSYYFLAEAISRLVFCNVIICNSGEYGDSLAFSPRSKKYERTIYRHKGQMLFSTQNVKVPVKSLDDEQQPDAKPNLYKSKPPGYLKKG